MNRKPTIFILSPGVGKDLRGFESHASDLTRLIRDEKDFTVVLIKGNGPTEANHLNVGILHRNSTLARVLGKLFRRNPYIIQTVSFFMALVPHLIRRRPELLYVADPPLYRYLYRWRGLTKASYRMIFHTGGNTVPFPMDPHDVLQAVTPGIVDVARHRGVHENQIFVIPHFIATERPPVPTTLFRSALRRKLGLPEDRLLILSVGAIDKAVKRMDYLVREVSHLNVPYFLLILGQMEQETGLIRNIADEVLTPGSFEMKTVSRDDLPNYYQTADLFALASLDEGFGIASLEALAFGLPVLTHPHPNAISVLGEWGYFADLTIAGNLTGLMETFIPYAFNSEFATRRSAYALSRFAWDRVKQDYRDLLLTGLASE